MKREIMNCLTWYANKVAETVQYTTWSDEFCRNELKKATDTFLVELKKHIDWNNLTKEVAMEWKMKREIMNCLTWYANKVAETVQYTTWSDEFCRNELKKATDTFLVELKKHIDWNNLTKEVAMELRFMRWEEEQPDFYLIPLYLLPILPIGIEVTSINGEKKVYDGTNVNNDIRFGCIAYGIYVKE